MADDQSLDTLMMIYMARRLDLKYVISYCGNSTIVMVCKARAFTITCSPNNIPHLSEYTILILDTIVFHVMFMWLLCFVLVNKINIISDSIDCV